ncbi:MAG: DUF2452 domain-containing protein [Chitinophagales bacterium]|nr:DUF2452 domain-containing protein [Chitinophagales bacterium]
MMEGSEDFINPIDKDKVAENPGLLPYAHTVGSAVIRPEDKGKIKGKSLLAMRQQTDTQLLQLQRQMQTLIEQAQEIQQRIQVSEMIYDADMGFEPLIGQTYYLFEKEDGGHVLTMISPAEWGKKLPYKAFVAKAFLMADHTWKIEKD